jgi:ABC-type phosphate/phosphonate transport system substrate-binding protein
MASLVLLGMTAAAPLAGAADAPAPSPAARTLAIVPFYSPERMWLLYTPLIDYLRRETGEPWELKLYPNHDSLAASICKGEVDVALLGPAPLGRVNRECGALPFLVSLGKEGKPVYHSMLLTTDPAVTTTAGLRGKRVGFFKGSTAAHIIPLEMLRDAGLGPGDFASVFFESQDRIMTALLSHELAGAGFKETLYQRFKEEPVRLLQTSEALPNFAFSALPSQPPARRERFVAALLKIRPRENAQDAGTVAGWDDEIKSGFVLPAPDFLPAVLRVDEISRSIMHENR